MLKLILQFRKVLNDALALLCLLLVSHHANGPVEIINSTSLGKLAIDLPTIRDILTMMMGHRSLAETEAKLDESEVRN